MYPGRPHNEFNSPEHIPCDDMQLIRDIVDDESTTDSESTTNDHAEASIWPDILELLTWAGNTVKTSLLSAFPFLE